MPPGMGEGLEMGKIKHWGVKSGSYVCNVELGLDKGTIRELVRACVFLRFTAAQGWAVGQRLRTT